MVKFLLVDDLDANLIALCALLQRDGLRLLCARSGLEALGLLRVHDVALAFIDVQMPQMDGLQLAEAMRGTERTRKVPIIFLTASGEHARHFRGYELGAVDFLTKPIDAHVLRSKADVFFELARQRAQLRRAAAENATQRAQLEALFKACPTGLMMMDRNGALLRMNPAAHRLWGTVPETRSLSDYRLWRGWWPESEDEPNAGRPLRADEWTAARVLRGEEAASDIIEIEPFDRPGERRTILNDGAAVRDVDGSIIGAVVAETDITDLKWIERQLRDSEAQFRALAENIPQMTWMSDAAGDAFWFNHRWTDFTGLPPERLQGWGWAEQIEPRRVANVVSTLRAVLKMGTVWENTYPMRAADGTYRWFLSRAFPLRNTAGEVVRWFGSSTDITALRETQHALREAQETIRDYARDLEKIVDERTARLRETVAELEAFSYSMAHDMRRPLRTMIGYAEVLCEDCPELSGAAKHYVQRIHSAAVRLDRLTHEVLTYAGLGRKRMELEPVPLSELISEVIDLYPDLQAARERIERPPNLPVVFGNKSALTQVFSNLLSNAIKFVPEGAQPRVRIGTQSVVNGPSGRVRITIDDEGIGVSPKHRHHLFQMFQRLAEGKEYDGHGMGLAITRRAVERLGGSIDYEPRDPVGSRFSVVLPVATPKPNG